MYMFWYFKSDIKICPSVGVKICPSASETTNRSNNGTSNKKKLKISMKKIINDSDKLNNILFLIRKL